MRSMLYAKNLLSWSLERSIGIPANRPPDAPAGGDHATEVAELHAHHYMSTPFFTSLASTRSTDPDEERRASFIRLVGSGKCCTTRPGKNGQIPDYTG